MTIQTISIGAAPNDGTGDPLRTAFSKANNNFQDLQTQVDGKEASGTAAAAVAAHVAVADPHPQYTTSAEATADAAAQVAGHVAQPDPHPQYNTAAEADAQIAAGIGAHVALSDPHAQYATDADLASHTGNGANPHGVTKAQVGLGNADNTSDANKPVSTPQQAVIDAKFATAIGKNIVINGTFSINQRAVSGSVVLAAGAYGHDRWKAGAAGCSYTFAVSGADTILTISAGSLVQVIEGANVGETSYPLSWTGTSQGKISGGVYGASPVVLAATPGSNLTVEFGVGTLSKVQTAPERRLIPFERFLCQWYFRRFFGATVYAIGQANNPTTSFFSISGGDMRASPTATFSGVNTNDGIAATAVTGISAVSRTGFSIHLQVASSGMVAGNAILLIGNSAASYLDLSSEL